MLAARPHRRSIFDLPMVEKRIVIHEPDSNIRQNSTAQSCGPYLQDGGRAGLRLDLNVGDGSQARVPEPPPGRRHVRNDRISVGFCCAAAKEVQGQ